MGDQNQAQPIDLSGGLVSAPQQGGGIDLSSGLVAKQSEQQQPPQSWWEKAKDYAQTAIDEIPGAQLAHYGGQLLSNYADSKAKQNQQENLAAAAKGQPLPHSSASIGAYGALRDLGGLEAGASSPEGMAVAGASMAAPQVVGPLLIAHGLYKAGSTAGKPQTPDNIQGELMGGAEAAGGASMLGGLAPSIKGMVNRVTGRAIDSATIDASPANSSFQAARNNTPREILDHAQANDIPLTPAQATGSGVARSIQAAGERAMVGGKDLTSQLDASRLAFADAVNNFADRVDPLKSGLTEDSTGDALQRSVQTARDVAHENASNAYKGLDWTKTTPVDTTAVQQGWMNTAKDMKTVLANAPPEVAAKLKSILNAGANLGTQYTGTDGAVITTPNLTFGDAAQLRSFFRDMGATYGAELPARYQGMWKKLTGDVDGAMDQSATQAGFSQEWRAANQGWKDYAQTYGDRSSPLYRVLNAADPTKVTRSLLNNSSVADVNALQKEGIDLGPLKRQVVNDISRQGFTVKQDGLGGYSNDFLRNLFGPSQTKELYLNADIGRRLGFEVNPSGTSNVLANIAQMTNPKVLAAMTGAAKVSAPRGAATFIPQAPATVPLSRLGGIAAASTASQVGNDQ